MEVPEELLTLFVGMTQAISLCSCTDLSSHNTQLKGQTGRPLVYVSIMVTNLYAAWLPGYVSASCVHGRVASLMNIDRVIAVLYFVQRGLDRSR